MAINKNTEKSIMVVWRLLSNLKVKVTRKTVVEYFQSHPSYFSIKGICNLFDFLNIPNQAIKINESDLFNLEVPFITFSNENRGSLLMVNSINNNHVIYIDSIRGVKTISIQGFLKQWKGIVILVEPNETSGESDYDEKMKCELIKSSLLPFSVLLFFVIGIYGFLNSNAFQNNEPKLPFLLLYLTHIIGLIISIYLLRLEFDISSKFINKFCHLSVMTDCNALTKSNASKIFGFITWADIGIIYFLAGLVVLNLFPCTSSLNILSLVSIITLLFLVFSISYQGFIIRKWCPLCLSIQFILIIEFIILAKYRNFNELRITDLLGHSLVFSIIFMIILIMKFLFISDRDNKDNRIQLLKLKQDPELFIYKLMKGRRIDIPFDNSGIIWGTGQSKVTITAFLSLNCSSCSKCISSIINLINRNINVRIQLIFSSSRNEMSSELLKILYNLTISNQGIAAFNLLNKWYKKDIKVKKEIRDVIIVQSKSFNDLRSTHAMFFQTGKVRKVPSIYINGFIMPADYSLDDLPIFLPKIEAILQDPK